MRIAVYVRVSTQRQAQAQTIEQQLERLQAHCQIQDWVWHEEDIFRDDGYSGSLLKRPGLDRLRDQAAQAAFDRVLITAPDRLARKYVHQVLLIEELERSGCLVEFLERPMSQDPHDQLLLQIRGAVAEYERSLISERMRRGRLQKLQAGTLLPWTRSPYGYRTDPDRPRDPTGVRVEEAEAPVIVEMFSSYLQEGYSLCGLAQHLMDLGIPSPSGATRWNQASVRGILTNPVYAGTVYAGRSRSHPAHQRHSPLLPVSQSRSGHSVTPREEWIAVAHVPPLVSQEDFERVQAKLAHNHQFASRNNTEHQYLLRGLISCGLCRLGCAGRTCDNYRYYFCRGKNGVVQSCRDEKCSSRMIPAKQVDEIVWQDLCAVLTHPEVIEAALLRAQGGAWLPQELQARRENLRNAHLSVNQQIERLTEAYLAGIITLEELKRRRQDLAQRQEAVTSQVRQLEARAAQQLELAQVMSTIQEFCQRVQNGLEQVTFEQKRQLVELLIDRVIVTNEEVEIRYVIPIRIKLSTVPNRVPPTRVGRCWDGFGVAECDSPTSSHAQSNAKPVLPPLRIRQP
jgi:site-specific DNA recombinase